MATIELVGTLRRRNGTSAPFRFHCVLDEQGHAGMFRITFGDAGANELVPSRLIHGVATMIDLKTPLPRGAALRLQLLDLKNDPKGEILAEQIVRSGWEVPIPFALRLPRDTKLDGRQLVVGARVVRARQIIYEMQRLRTVTAEELQRPVKLELGAVSPS